MHIYIYIYIYICVCVGWANSKMTWRQLICLLFTITINFFRYGMSSLPLNTQYKIMKDIAKTPERGVISLINIQLGNWIKNELSACPRVWSKEGGYKTYELYLSLFFSFFFFFFSLFSDVLFCLI